MAISSLYSPKQMLSTQPKAYNQKPLEPSEIYVSEKVFTILDPQSEEEIKSLVDTVQDVNKHRQNALVTVLSALKTMAVYCPPDVYRMAEKKCIRALGVQEAIELRKIQLEEKRRRMSWMVQQ